MTYHDDGDDDDEDDGDEGGVKLATLLKMECASTSGRVLFSINIHSITCMWHIMIVHNAS